MKALVIKSFLSEADITEIRSKLPDYFKQVELRGWRNQKGQLLGFIGLADNYIEMLFIDSNARGQGIGKALFKWAQSWVQSQGAIKVDVNEQNSDALNFYLHLGFTQISRSEKDKQGRPYPIIHLELKI